MFESAQSEIADTSSDASSSSDDGQSDSDEEGRGDSESSGDVEEAFNRRLDSLIRGGTEDVSFVVFDSY